MWPAKIFGILLRSLAAGGVSLVFQSWGSSFVDFLDSCITFLSTLMHRGRLWGQCSTRKKKRKKQESWDFFCRKHMTGSGIVWYWFFADKHMAHWLFLLDDARLQHPEHDRQSQVKYLCLPILCCVSITGCWLCGWLIDQLSCSLLNRGVVCCDWYHYCSKTSPSPPLVSSPNPICEF